MAASKPSAEQLITDNIDVWTSAIKKRGSQGRGSNKKIELYGVKKLRELILELAVRGLLVPQNPNDEPASVLLEKIAVEKEHLKKGKKIKKQKPLSDIRDDEKPFDIPYGWEWSRLGDLLSPLRPLTYGVLKPGTNTKDGVPLVKTENVQFRYVIDEFNSKITNELDEQYSRTKLVGGEILVTLVGSIGRCAIANEHLKGANLSRSVGLVVPAYDAIKEFLVIEIFTLINEGYIESNCAGTAQKVLNVGTLNNLVVPTPPEAEYPRIVAKVNELMALCDQLEQQTETSLTAHQTLVESLLNTLLTAAQTAGTKESSSQTSSFDLAWNRIAQHFDVLFTTEHSIDQLKQTILQLAVMGKLVPQDPNDEPASVLLEKIAAEKEQLIKDKKIKKQKPLPPITDDEKPFELPVGWEWTRLGSIISLISGQHLKPSEYFETKSDNAVPYITGPAEFGALNPTYSKFTNEKRALAEDGDILITCKGSGLGKWNIAHETIAISRQLMAIRPVELDDEYLKLVIDSKYDLFQSKGVGIAIPGISREDITDVLVGLPSETELHRITDKVSSLMEICADLKERIRESQNTQLYLADAMGDSIFGRTTITNFEEKEEKKAMKISTELSLGSVEYDKTAILAPLIGDDGADAKAVWNKSRLELPEFYKQLKSEIKLGFVAEPAKAEFEG